MKKKFGFGFAAVIMTLALLSAACSNTSDASVYDDPQVRARTWAVENNLTEIDDFSWVDATTESNANGIIKRHPQEIPSTPVATIKLYRNGANMGWVGDTKIGPSWWLRSRFQKIEFDTGSPCLWAVSSKCKIPGFSNKYKPGPTSENLKRNFQFRYAAFSVVGLLYSDTVNVGGIKIRMSFGAMTGSWPIGIWTANSGDGVLGLSRSPASFPQRSHFFTLAKEKYPHFNPVAAFYFKTEPELHLGQVKEVYLGDKIEYHPVIELSNDRAGLWTIGDGEISVGGKTIVTGTRTIFDTGARMVYGPPEEVAKIYGEIPGSHPFLTFKDGREFYRFRCNHGIGMSFKWGSDGNTWPILPENLGFPLDANDEWCEGAIVGWKLPYDEHWETLWMFGDPFMWGFYLVFDYGLQRLGLAAAK